MIKYYEPIQEIVKYYNEKYIGKKVLEIGPGKKPFPAATHFIDHIKLTPETIILDINTEKLPFEDKEFDFIYCRHVLEDIQNPDFAFKEMTRVGKNGYIETPSPISEITRGIDGGSPFWRGYIHHRNIIWEKNGIIFLLPKFPLIEYIQLPDTFNILKDKWCWNTYYEWEENNSPSCKVLKLDIDYNIRDEYELIIKIGMEESLKNIFSFKSKIISKNF